ncbi:MAG: hypothetical protein ACOC0A_01630 [Planctomycetota bacterium]
MKVYFGESLDEMVREIGARGTETVRVHAVSHGDASDEVRIDVHTTTLCGGQIYEAVTSTFHFVEGEGAARRERIQKISEEERNKVAEKFRRFEVRRGILQE